MYKKKILVNNTQLTDLCYF